MRRLAANDYGAQVDTPRRNRKSGRSPHSVLIFKENGIKMEAMKAEQAKREQAVAAEKKKFMDHLVEEFQASIGNIAATVSAASNKLQGQATNLSEVSKGTSRKAMTVAAASEETSVNVQVVASAAEELTASIREISAQVDEAAHLISDAVTQIRETDRTVQGVGMVARLKSARSLNSSIKSPVKRTFLPSMLHRGRAGGEAGKGFAVVASEVKNLANQKRRKRLRTSRPASLRCRMKRTSCSGLSKGFAKVIEKISSVSEAYLSLPFPSKPHASAGNCAEHSSG
jgi:hypothetical protein